MNAGIREFLEVRIPISPRPYFFNRVRLITHSIRSLGGPYANARVQVTVGIDDAPFDLEKAHPWSRALGIEWIWVKSDLTGSERFRPPFKARNILLLDADVIAIRPFDDLIDYVNSGSGGFGGVMAHFPPFQDDALNWGTLFQGFGLAPPSFSHELSGWAPCGGTRYSPPYFNMGVICGPARVFEEFHQTYFQAIDFIKSHSDTFFIDQIALTLSVGKAPELLRAAPVRFNFPNQAEFDNVYSQELMDVRFLHFLRTGIVRRDEDFTDRDAIWRLIQRTDLTGSNEILRRRLEELLPLL